MNTIDWKNATPEQINLWKLVNGLIAWTAITPLYYQGVIAGSEFLTYDAAKLYIALELETSTNDAISAITVPDLALYNEANAINFYLRNLDSVCDTAGPTVFYWGNNASIKNVYFGRILPTGYDYMKFNGYRLDII